MSATAGLAEVPGLVRVPMPIGLHGIESVNVYVLADGDKVTLVDCGVWRSAAGDAGLSALEQELQGAGYALRDVSRIIVTHAHIDHYGLAGKLMELTGAELWMHAMTDLDCEKYRHPDTAIARRRDMYADHGLAEPELSSLSRSLDVWLPYLYSVVEASKRLRGGERIGVGGRDWEVIHTPGHSYGHICLYSPSTGAVLSGDHLLPGVTPPVTFERGFDSDPLRSYLGSLSSIAERNPRIVLPGHGRPFGDCARRIEAIARSKARRTESIMAAIQRGPRTVVEIADELFASSTQRFQRNFALAEALAHIAYLRGSGLVERRIRGDSVYEWYPVRRS